ncbi:MAG: hypothetical protein FWH42_00520 [Dehalococcoidia bacterium]|nr:hypothetical protein [Dehalococcoidia bacterium]
MDEFRKKIADRVILLSVGLFIACCALVYFCIDVSKGKQVLYSDKGTTWIQILIIVVLISVLLSSITRCVMAIRYPNRLKKLQVYETDERNVFIKQKTGSIGINIIMYGLAIMTIIIGSNSVSTFWGLFLALIFVMLVHISLVLYYRHKF